MKIVRKKDKIVIESILNENDYNSFLEDYNHVLNESEKGNDIPAGFVLQMLNKLGAKSDFEEINIQIETITSKIYGELKPCRGYDFHIPIEGTHIVLSLKEMIWIGVSTALANDKHPNDPNIKKDLVTLSIYNALIEYTRLIPNQWSDYKACVITGLILTEIEYPVVYKKKPKKKNYYDAIKHTIKRLIKEKGED